MVEQFALVTMNPPWGKVAWERASSRWSGLTSGMSSGTSARMRWEAALENTATPASASAASASLATSVGRPENANRHRRAMALGSSASILMASVSSWKRTPFTLRTSPSVFPSDRSEAYRPPISK